MTALPKASGMVEDHPLCRKMLSRGRFLWTSAAGKNTPLAEAKRKKLGEAAQREKKASQRKQVSCKPSCLCISNMSNVLCFFLLRHNVRNVNFILRVQQSSG